MTPGRQVAPRQRLAACALIGFAPVTPALAGSTAARLMLGAYALAVTLFLGWWLHRRRPVADTRLSQQFRRVSALVDAGRAVNSAHELDTVLQTILDSAVGIVGAGTGSVMLCDADVLTVVAAVGNDKALGRSRALGDGIAGRAAATRTPLHVEGEASTTSYPGLAAGRAVVESALSIPMIDRGELVGVLNVGAPAGGVFDIADLETLAAFGESAATAISKARLYEASRRASEELAHRATHDILTGLPNRALLRERITERTHRERSRDAVLFVDLDGFKQVNDELGHSAGDRLLCLAAERLRESCPAGALTARVGGDEFVVFLPDCATADDAVAVAVSLIDALRRPIPFEGEAISVSASVGIALTGEHGSSYPELMEAADAALYQAKRAGKGCWHLAAPRVPGDDIASSLPRPRRRVMTSVAGDHGPR